MYWGFDNFTDFASGFITTGILIGFGFYAIGYALSPSKFISRVS